MILIIHKYGFVPNKNIQTFHLCLFFYVMGGGYILFSVKFQQCHDCIRGVLSKYCEAPIVQNMLHMAVSRAVPPRPTVRPVRVLVKFKIVCNNHSPRWVSLVKTVCYLQ